MAGHFLAHAGLAALGAPVVAAGEVEEGVLVESARKMTEPPSPPSPPSGPPRGTYFSRRKWIEPSPPRPAMAVSFARSWNIAGTLLGK
jgi:hypothetical protein